MKYIFENSLRKKGINQKLEKELKKFWKKKRISCTDHRDYLAFFKSLPNCTFFINIGDEVPYIPSLPNCEVFLNNVNKSLTTLPPLPKCRLFSCRKSSLTKLPSLPNAKYIECSNNKITTIGKLSKCEKLDCHSNPITKIEENKKLKQIYCSKTLLKTLTVPKDCYVDSTKKIKVKRI